MTFKWILYCMFIKSREDNWINITRIICFNKFMVTLRFKLAAILGPQFCRILVLGPHFWWSGGGPWIRPWSASTSRETLAVNCKSHVGTAIVDGKKNTLISVHGARCVPYCEAGEWRALYLSYIHKCNFMCDSS